MKQDDENKTKDINGEPTLLKAFGSTGTEIYAGYLDEEYLKELTGSDRAKIFDRMRRGDAIIRMITQAVRLPIKGADWQIVELGESTPEGLQQKEFLEYVIFEEMEQSFTKLMGEILSFFDFGYSLFEIVNKVVVDSKVGPHVGIKKIAFRSPKTIERWIIEDGELQFVEQQVDGDSANDGPNVRYLDARFLAHFCPDQEGDDYEGLAALRSCYGAWKRKNLFLKLLAAGIEKYAIPTPIATVPAGEENSKERQTLEKILKCYSSNQSNYIMTPEGYKIDLISGNFDSQKVRAAINEENQEMVNSVLASFLLLGQNGAGSLALSDNLSGFFGTALKSYADHISEVFNEKILKKIVAQNFPNQELVCSLQAGNLLDNANASYAGLMSTLAGSGLVKPDKTLEAHLREKFSLPPIDEDTREETPLTPAFKFSERTNKKAAKMQDILDRTQREYSKTFEKYLGQYADELIKKLVAKSKLKGDKRYSKITEVYKPVPQAYINELKDIAAKETMASLNTFPEYKEELKFSEYDNMPKSIKSKLLNRITMQAQSQFHDIEKMIMLDYLGIIDQTDSPSEIEFKLKNTKSDALTASILQTGAAVLSAETVTTATLDTISESEMVESWTFIAEVDEATTDICRALNDRTFEDGDPDIMKYRPPLHFNCRSVLIPNKKTFKDNPPIDQDPLVLSKSALDSKQLGEKKCCG
jgi:SPP1 gp7 family putative phage head morphogenesis protein